MMLVELTAVPLAALPVASFKDHLRLGSGFADDGLQDAVLEDALRAALAAVEGRTGKALIERDFSLSVAAWRDLAAQSLPLAPVSAISALVITDRLGADTLIDAARYRLEPDTHRPRLVANSLVLPAIPVGGRATISFTAGYGPAWADLPADIARAVLMLAAHFYEHRHEGAMQGNPMPFGVSALLDRYRNLRLFGGPAR